MWPIAEFVHTLLENSLLAVYRRSACSLNTTSVIGSQLSRWWPVTDSRLPETNNENLSVSGELNWRSSRHEARVPVIRRHVRYHLAHNTFVHYLRFCLRQQININSRVPVTTAWRLLHLRTETTCKYGGWLRVY